MEAKNNNLYSTDLYKDNIIMIAVETKKGILNKKDSLDELSFLIQTTGNNVVGQLTQNLTSTNKKHYIGKGKLEELKSLIELHDANCIVCDDELKNNQIKFLEEYLEVKVIDRTLVILDIFAKHATTHEGKIQVELAKLNYRLNHVVGSYEHLSKQGAGIGSKGSGEKKLESDKRLIRDRISFLKKEILEIENHRNLQRVKKKKNQTPLVAILGYTNSGKSTLLNLLTDANILSEDKLFATLDTTTRKFKLPSNKEILLVDTVGFIQNLPHQLIKSFNSTLNEGMDADVIIHLVDASSPVRTQYIDTVNKTLETIGCLNKEIITVFNKIDRDVAIPLPKNKYSKKIVSISAVTGEGIPELIQAIEHMLLGHKKAMTILIPYSQSSLTSSIYKHCDVLKEDHTNDGVIFDILATDSYYSKLKDYLV